MNTTRYTFFILILVCIVNISCSQSKIKQDKNLPYKITISGTEGLKFDGYYQTGKKANGEPGDSIHINGVIPAEYYLNESRAIYCSVGKQGKGLIRLTISNKETGDIAADSSNYETGLIFVTTAELNGHRFSGPGIKDYPPAFFLNVVSNDTIPHFVIIYKDWDAGVHLSTTLQEKCPFTVPLPQCDVIAASFMATTDMKEFYVTLTDANNNILKKDSSVDKNSFNFEFRTKPKEDK